MVSKLDDAFNACFGSEDEDKYFKDIDQNSDFQKVIRSCEGKKRKG